MYDATTAAGTCGVQWTKYYTGFARGYWCRVAVLITLARTRGILPDCSDVELVAEGMVRVYVCVCALFFTMFHLFVCLFVPRVLLHRRERTWLEIRFRMHCALHCTQPVLVPSLTGRILPGFGCCRRANGGIFCAVLRSIGATAAGSCLLRRFSFVFHFTHCCMADIQSLQRKWSEK